MSEEQGPVRRSSRTRKSVIVPIVDDESIAETQPVAPKRTKTPTKSKVTNKKQDDVVVETTKPTKRSSRKSSQSPAPKTPTKSSTKSTSTTKSSTDKKSPKRRDSTKVVDISDDNEVEENIIKILSQTPTEEVTTETITGPDGQTIVRQTTTTTVTTVVVEETDDIELTPPEVIEIHRRASLFRSFVLADWITMLNAICGVSSILFCLNYLANDQQDKYLQWAFLCLPFALFFDISDGWVARKQGKQSPYGSDLDSLSDCISFTLAPAVLAFTCGFRSMWDSIILCFFTFCGISRLARFNVTSQNLKKGEKVAAFYGLPTPSSLLLDAGLAFLHYKGLIHDKLPYGTIIIAGKQLHLLSFVFLIWGCLFVSSTLRIPKP